MNDTTPEHTGRGAEPPAARHGPVELPSWMRDPDSVPVTLGQRRNRWLARQPRLQAALEAWWLWWDRPRLSQRYPRVVPVVSFFLVAVSAAVLITAVAYLFHKIVTEGY